MEITDKKRQRLEKKKKKIDAFLQVARLNDADKVKKNGDGTSVTMLSPITESSKATPSSTSKVIVKQPNRRSLDDEEFWKWKAEADARSKLNMERPKIFTFLDWINIYCDVCPPDPKAAARNKLPMASDDKLPSKYYNPLFAVDIQHLILFCLQKHTASFLPRWCKVLRVQKFQQLVVLEMCNVSKQMFMSSQEMLTGFKELKFDVCVEVISPVQYFSSFLGDILDVSLSISHYKAKMQAQGIKTVANPERKPIIIKQSNEKIAESLVKDLSEQINGDSCSRLCLLLSPEQLVLEGYPLPIDLDGTHKNFVYTKDKYEDVTDNSPMFALDCEMCMCGDKLVLTSIAVVNENLDVIYSTLVKPYKKITNYVTRYSGITKKLLSKVTTRIEDVQAKLQEILPADAILCGQSLGGDLRAIEMFHPYVIDTSIIYNLSGRRQMKTSLKILTSYFLKKTIQDDEGGHDPAEDAIATMELVKLKLKEGYEFGDVILGGSLVSGVQNVIVPEEEPSTDKRKLDGDGEEDEQPKKHIRYDDYGSAISKSDSDTDGSEEDMVRPSRTNMTGVPDREKATMHQNVFFRRKGSFLSESLFDVFHAEGKSVSVIAPEVTITNCKEVPGFKHVKLETVKSNGSCVTACQLAAKSDTYLTWGQFPSVIEDEVADVEASHSQKLLKQVDTIVKQVADSCKPRTLLMVLLGGLPIPSSHANAVCLAKVT